MTCFRRKLDAQTRARLEAIRARARGLARHGERETQVISRESMASLVRRAEAV